MGDLVPARADGWRVRIGVTGAAALVLPLILAGCGDDEAETSSSAFCESVTEIDAEIQDADDDESDASDLADQADRLAGLEPPEEIAEEWQVFVDGVAAAAQEGEGSGGGDGQSGDGQSSGDQGSEGDGGGDGEGEGGGVESAREEAARAEEFQIASRIVTAYLEDNCGLEPADDSAE